MIMLQLHDAESISIKLQLLKLQLLKQLPLLGNKLFSKKERGYIPQKTLSVRTSKYDQKIIHFTTG